MFALTPAPYDFTRQGETGIFSDCQIKCQGRTWKLHKIILAARSKFFESAFTIGLKETVNSEVTLDEENPDDVDRVLRYIYSGNLSHLDAQTAADVTGMNLSAYKVYIPLYILGDFLGIPNICDELLSRLHLANRILAAHLQRRAVKGTPLFNNNNTFPPNEQQTPQPACVNLTKLFITDFAECAAKAYSIPVTTRTQAEVNTALPGGLRNIFVQLFELVRYSPLNGVLDHVSGTVPELLVDIIASMQAAGGFQVALMQNPRDSRYGYCVHCGINPLNGVCQYSPHQHNCSNFSQRHPAPKVDKENFWVRDGLCFGCSGKYTREQLFAFGGERPV